MPSPNGDLRRNGPFNGLYFEGGLAVKLFGVPSISEWLSLLFCNKESTKKPFSFCSREFQSVCVPDVVQFGQGKPLFGSCLRADTRP